MKKTLLIIVSSLFTAVPLAHAVCPVCTVAVGAGLGLAEYLGIDDLISGLWIGALIVSISLWTISWLQKKKIKNSTLKNEKFDLEEFRALEKAQEEETEFWKRQLHNIFIFLIYYAVIIIPLYWKGYIGRPFNKFCGVDKLLFGIVLGSILFAAGVIFHNYIRKRNNNRSYFKGQKIVFSIIPIVITSIILYFTC